MIENELAGKPHLQLLFPPRKPASNALQMRDPVEPAQRHLEGRV
jgi:hypothetical protein